MSTRNIALWLVMATLGGALPADAAVTVTGQHATVTAPDDQQTAAALVAATIDEAWPILAGYFAPLGLADSTPLQVEINPGLSAPGGSEAWGYTYPDGRRIEINPSTPYLKGTVAHEMFHGFLLRSGFPAEGAEWLLGGASDMAEHLVWPAEPHKLVRMENYLFRYDIHGRSLLDAGHHAQLFLYYLHHHGPPDSIRQMLVQYKQSRDGAAVAAAAGLGGHWREFVKGMWNDDAAPAVWRINEPGFEDTRPQRQLMDVSSGVVSVSATMPPLSYYTARVIEFTAVQASHATVFLHDIRSQPNLFVHAFRRDAGSSEYRYEDWTGRPYVRFCLRQQDVCENETPEPIADLWLLIGNDSLTASQEMKLHTAAGLAPKWRATEVQLSSSLVAPTRGDLFLEFGTNGGTLVRSQGWWLEVPESSFQGQSRRAYRWINQRCRMKGFVKSQLVEPRGKVDQASGAAEIEWDGSRVDQGEFYTNPTRFACDFRKEMFVGVAGGAALAGTVARVFTDLNTREYPPDSFAMRLSNAMTGVMTLGIAPTGVEDVRMSLEHAPGHPPKLTIEIQGNVRAFFEPVFEASQ